MFYRLRQLSTHIAPSLFLAMALLWAQLGTLKHEIEHFSHADQELCQGFINFAKSASLVGTPQTTSHACEHDLFTQAVVQPTLAQNSAAHPIRAPPRIRLI